MWTAQGHCNVLVVVNYSIHQKSTLAPKTIMLWLFDVVSVL